MSQVRREFIKQSWSDTDEEDNHYQVCEDCQIDETPREVQSEIEHFFYDQFILEFHFNIFATSI